MGFDRWRYVLPLRLRSLFRSNSVDRELDDELQFHIERQIELNVARGMNPAEARHAAIRAMGGVEQQKEACRDQRRVQKRACDHAGDRKGLCRHAAMDPARNIRMGL